MALDIHNLNQTQLLQLVNHTPLGVVLDRPRLRRQLDVAAYRIGDGKRVSLVRYVAWLSREVDKPKTQRQSVDDARSNELAAKNEKRRAAQDIGEIPAVADPERRARAVTEFRFFCTTYFPAVFSLPWSQDHRKVLAKIEQCVTDGGLFAFAMPRGSGKSTLTMAATVWAILKGARRYVCLIGSDKGQSSNLFQSIKMAMMGNELLLKDFPEVILPIQKLENSAHKQRGQRYQGELTYPEWSAEKIVMPTIPGSVASGSVITVESLDSNIRGQFHTTIAGQIVRPDLVLIDDPQTRGSARSAAQTKQRMDILNGDVLGMAGPGKKISGLLTCTKIYAEDLADQILDTEKNPEWQGECTRMVYAFPTNEKLWEQYAEIRKESLRSGNKGKEATAFYEEHREAMDAGAVLAWPERFDEDEISAVQNAMNLRIRNEEAFFAEYQNDPLSEQDDDEVLTVAQVMDAVNGRPRREAPLRAQHMTAFIDLHDNILFYVICAWEEDFTGYVIDYGTYPDQKRTTFTQRKAQRTLQQLSPGANKEGAILAGLESLCGDLLQRDWKRAGGAAMRIDRCLIDAGYMPGVVENVRHRLGGGTIMASKGMGIRAANKPISSYRRKPGERHGHHWYVPNIRRTGEFPHVVIDTNYWKSFVHERLGMAVGDRSGLTLFGKQGSRHQLFAQHIADSEFWVRTEGHGRVVYEWKNKPGVPDNHWLDCLVGNAVAASMLGCKLAGHKVSAAKRKRVKLSELQQKARAR